jgi:tRNA nucleotidyltransferase (CCA-adding enzyme)
MSPDEYLQAILTREAVDTGPFSPVRGMQGMLYPIIQKWAGNRLLGVHPSGSFMKGTANMSGTDIDLFISLSEQTRREINQYRTFHLLRKADVLTC